MGNEIDSAARDALFLKARSFKDWAPGALTLSDLRKIYELTAGGPTSANGSPARFVFLTTDEARQRLAKHVAPSNFKLVTTAPVSVIVAYDLAFYEKLPQLFPGGGEKMAASMLSNPQMAATNAVRNGTLQGGYFIMAVRALGFDCGPMSGFNNAAVDEEFFAGTAIKSNFVCSIGVGDVTTLPPKPQRMAFEDACQVL